MKKSDIWKEVDFHLSKYKEMFPHWPDHIVAQAAVVSMAANDLIGVAHSVKYKDEMAHTVTKEILKYTAFRAMAACLRFIEKIETNEIIDKPEEGTGGISTPASEPAALPD